MFHLQFYSFDRAGALTLLIIFVTNKILQRKTLFNQIRGHTNKFEFICINMAHGIINCQEDNFWAPTEAQKLLLSVCQSFSF